MGLIENKLYKEILIPHRQMVCEKAIIKKKC